MVIARGEFIYELEKNVEFRQRHAERERVRREKEEAARKFVEEYDRIVGEAAQETEIAIDKKLTEMGLKSAGDVDELKFQVIYEMPSRYGVVTSNPDKKGRGISHIQLRQTDERCNEYLGSEIQKSGMEPDSSAYQGRDFLVHDRRITLGRHSGSAHEHIETGLR